MLNIPVEGKHQKPILTDLFFRETQQKKPVVIFCHGYKGFKDWGAFHLLAPQVVSADLAFVKFNFSHNGGTVEQPIDFPDLEAFSQNTYEKELDDLQSLIDWLSHQPELQEELDTSTIHLIGHSRGGGIALIKAAEEQRVRTVTTWAGVSDYGSRFVTGKALAEWKKNGVMYVENGRTKQQMPHDYQFYTSYMENPERFSIQKATAKLRIPQLIIHGDADPSVAPKEAEQLHQWNPKSELYWVPGADHVFGAKHPWTSETLPADLEKVVLKTLQYIQTEHQS